LQRREGWAIRRWIYAERDYVRHVLLRHGAEDGELDDLMQEVFYQAIRSLPSFEGNAKVTTWLYSIARNVAYTHQRNARSHRTLTDNLLRHLQPQIDGARSMSAELSGPREDTIQRERSSFIRRALEQLPDHYAEIIRLRDLQEQSTREAAQALGITEVNARVRLHRARKALRTQMEAYRSAE
jgi:RNA polymerase sigma-70 factor (ECF subfamily)